MLILRIQQKLVLATEKEAIAPLTALAGVLASATRSGRLWARLRRRLVPFDAGTIEFLLSAERSLHADDPGQVTHVLSLCGTPEGPGEVGVVLVNVRPDAPPGAAPGITLSASLSDDVFDTSSRALQSLLERCVDAIAADTAVIGPDARVRELGAGWATFARRLRRDALPAGAVVVAARDGALVLAHAEDPASESALARAAVTRVHEAMQPERTALAPEPQIDGPPPAPHEAPVIPSPPPTYLIPAPSPARAARPPAADLACTAPAPDPPRGPALPFVEGPRCGPPPSPALLDRPLPPRAALTGTSLPLDVPPGPALPFAASVAGAASPIGSPFAPTMLLADGEVPAGVHMTLEQYALFRAHLTLRGEEDAETLKAFGVGSLVAKEALQARFAWLFKQDQAAQAAFVELVRKLSTQLRAQPPRR